ncbi:hypothetical protein HD598_002692 [Neomicrococcus aestuarii]|uniref:Uncharacterized protein n=1 Tax=Neomicrococcus aestuarii TaxID=556325 RepID=A0A7W8TW14_9MICC|nr:hypothetical protein [Neomicrococcus aestuarii]MBB5513945.1 hypothetical protein [Neomicrococcus aestuarii]
MTENKPSRGLTKKLGHVASESRKPSGDLGILFAKNRSENAPAPQETPQPAAIPKASERTPGVTDSVSNRLTESVTNRVPKYRQLKRREARIHEEQADELTLMARQLNMQRKRPDGTTVGERITDNTLIRVAIDLLLKHREELHGTSEQELAISLGLTPREVPSQEK